MTNAELIDLFRNVERSNHPVCNGCPMKYTCDKNQITRCLFGTAADALEAAERLLDQNTKRCEALRKQLRESNESYEKHINELESQLPKDGEWALGIDADGDPVIYCTNCMMPTNVKTNYCPDCGAKMKGEQE